MSFSYSFDLLSTLEVVGIVLAVIGFFNLSEKLERMFSGIQKGLVAYANSEITEARSFWPPHKNKKRMAIEAVKSFPISGGLYGLTVFLMGWWAIMWQGYLGLPTLFQIAVIVSIIIGLILNELFAVFIVTRLFALIAHIFSRTFRLLAVPPSGMTGTLGLLISITSFVIGKIQ